MKKFQIRFTKNGCGHFEYFEADKDFVKAAEEKANAYLEKGLTKPGPFNAFEPIKTITVVEYDNEKKETKRSGIKFKLRLQKVVAKYSSGRKQTTYWYEGDKEGEVLTATQQV